MSNFILLKRFQLSKHVLYDKALEIDMDETQGSTP